ncbi:uncharacterized protein LOC144488525, partial [Mustelus asterias]
MRSALGSPGWRSGAMLSALGSPGWRSGAMLSALGSPGWRSGAMLSALGSPGWRSGAMLSALGSPGWRSGAMLSALGCPGWRSGAMLSALGAPGWRSGAGMAAGSGARDGVWILEREGAERERLELGERQVTVGRGLDVTHRLLARNCPLMISRNHCSFQVTPERQCTVTDNQSLNGVWVNGKRVEPLQAYPLKEGDLIQLGVPLHSKEQAEYLYRLAWHQKMLPTTVEEPAMGSSTGNKEAGRVKRKHSPEEMKPSDSESVWCCKNKLQRVCDSHRLGSSTSQEGQCGMTERVNTGTERVNTGTERVNTGTERVNTETERVNTGTERVNTETERVNTEMELVNTGTERVNTETERVNTGTERVNTETERVNTETERVNTGTERVNTGPEHVNTGTGQEGQCGTAESEIPGTSREGQCGVAEREVPGTSWRRKAFHHRPGRRWALSKVQGAGAQAQEEPSGKSWQSEGPCCHAEGLEKQQEELEGNLERQTQELGLLKKPCQTQQQQQE